MQIAAGFLSARLRLGPRVAFGRITADPEVIGDCLAVSAASRSGATG